MATVFKTIGATARQFSTLSGWEASLPANLVTDGNSYVGQCFNDAEFTASGALLSITSITTDATHTITLTTGTGQSFADNASAQTNALKYNASNGVGIRMTGAYNTLLSMSGTSNVTFSKLQFKTDNASGSFVMARGGGSSAATFDGCIFDGRVNFPVITSSSDAVKNCLVIARDGSDGLHGPFASSVTVDNCTIVCPSDLGPGTNGITNSYGSITVKNTAVFGYTNFASLTSGSTGSGSNNCSDTTIGFGTSNQASKTYANQFVGTASSAMDFKIKTGADCVDNGTTDAATPVDIVGTTRPQGSAYDIGCWELVSGVAPTVAAISHFLTLMGVGV